MSILHPAQTFTVTVFTIWLSLPPPTIYTSLPPFLFIFPLSKIIQMQVPLLSFSECLSDWMFYLIQDVLGRARFTDWNLKVDLD